MGEKERGALEEEQRQTQQASFGERDVRPPRDSGSGLPTGRTAGGISHEDDWGSQTPAGVATGDVGGDGGADGDSARGAVERQTPKTDFGDRMAAGGNVETDPGGGEPTPAESAIVKSKSNITNNRND